MTDSILLSLTKSEVDYWMDRAKGDIIFAETLVELELNNKKVEYIMDQDWITVPLGRKKPPPKKPPIIPPKVTKNIKLDAETEIMKHQKVNLNLALALQQARQKRNWSRKDLGVQINEHERTIKDYENSKAIPNNTLIAKLERALNIHLRGDKIGQEIKHIKIEI